VVEEPEIQLAQPRVERAHLAKDLLVEAVQMHRHTVEVEAEAQVQLVEVKSARRLAQGELAHLTQLLVQQSLMQAVAVGRLHQEAFPQVAQEVPVVVEQEETLGW